MPETPVSAASYTQHGLPWFDLLDEHIAEVTASDMLAEVQSVTALDRQNGTVEATVEATQLSAFNPFALAAAQTAIEVELVHGAAAGSIATLNIPAAQMQRPQGLESAQNIKEWPLRLVPLPTAGDDQWTLELT